ncbi:putative pentatricopeptide repeat-containing protein At3g13770, mitochondrial [Aristolochia californica]|uniref:putative pentatricopeptide repeat-containing protein At3g13770, mitochondrial n=1 Tax=Aristolochia californica TaxID=171875 RepID=UPI0035DA97FE
MRKIYTKRFSSVADSKTFSSTLPLPRLNNISIPSKSDPNRSVSRHLDDPLLRIPPLGQNVNFKCYEYLLTECINQNAARQGQSVHGRMIKTHYISWVYLSNRLMAFYIKWRQMGDAQRVLDAMPEPSVASWTTMIAGYTRNGCTMEALQAFVQMMETGVSPNEFTFSAVLTACSRASDLDLGKQVHSLLIKSSFELHTVVGSALLDMYAKGGQIHEARIIFSSLPQRDVVSCTAMIAAHAQLGLDEEALELFCQLQKEGMRSNYVTYTSVLTALSGLAALDYGRQLHNMIIRFELPFYVVLQNSLIGMYSKCGSLKYSIRVFENMPEKTVVTWNAMLLGYAKHGLGEMALELFTLMKNETEIKPDSITYMAVLSGCSHGGLVEKGLDIFTSLVHMKDVQPTDLHYGCVVDLLGRAGQLEKALEFIKQMPFEPTASIWGALLGACRVHANVHIAEYVAQKLFMIEPENATNYVILSNIYAAAGRWEDVIKVRGLMEEKIMLKEPGRSWIKLDKLVHTFHAGDKLHPRKEEIFAKIKELTIKIKEVGYVPDLSCVLYDVDDEQKESILLNHSEKLAIGIGLISSPETVPIQVVKNLRICVDCHNFAKFVSKIYGRDISLRDSKRFHHVVKGVCSCGDYW